MALDPIPDKNLQDLKRIRKNLVFKEIFFKKILIMHRKRKSSKIRERYCNAVIQAANIYNISTRSVVSKIF